MKITKTILLAGAVALVSFTSGPAGAQATAVLKQEATDMANACLADWQAPGCLKQVSNASYVLAANYSAALEQGGHKTDAEQVKQHCAASTAGMKGDYPAYAMKSAFTECANTITDTAAKTNVMPDPAQFQLLVGPTICLSGDPRCAAVTTGLKPYATAR